MMPGTNGRLVDYKTDSQLAKSNTRETRETEHEQETLKHKNDDDSVEVESSPEQVNARKISTPKSRKAKTNKSESIPTLTTELPSPRPDAGSNQSPSTSTSKITSATPPTSVDGEEDVSSKVRMPKPVPVKNVSSRSDFRVTKNKAGDKGKPKPSKGQSQPVSDGQPKVTIIKGKGTMLEFPPKSRQSIRSKALQQTSTGTAGASRVADGKVSKSPGLKDNHEVSISGGSNDIGRRGVATKKVVRTTKRKEPEPEIFADPTPPSKRTKIDNAPKNITSSVQGKTKKTDAKPQKTNSDAVVSNQENVNPETQSIKGLSSPPTSVAPSSPVPEAEEPERATTLTQEDGPTPFVTDAELQEIFPQKIGRKKCIERDLVELWCQKKGFETIEHLTKKEILRLIPDLMLRDYYKNQIKMPFHKCQKEFDRKVEDLKTAKNWTQIGMLNNEKTKLGKALNAAKQKFEQFHDQYSLFLLLLEAEPKRFKVGDDPFAEDLPLEAQQKRDAAVLAGT